MENNTESYKTVLLIPENEWLLVKEQLKELQNGTNLQKESTKKQTEEEENNRILPYDEACKFLGIGKESLVRAKNEGRIKGIRGHSRGFSYRMCDLIQYKKNFGRRPKIV
jgi:hypothetical protein